MEYEDCRIRELVNHAAREDARAQALLIEELRSYARDIVERYGASREATPDFAQQVLTCVRRDYGKFWDSSSEFGTWIDRALQREVEAACARDG
jgi:DNA-directed RNA polymerase specialized sigma24 family protein